VQMVIRKAEERAMGIQEQVTVYYRERFAIPDSDGLEPEEKADAQKRSRSDTVSTTYSQDSYTHHQPEKRTRLDLDNILEN
jgi:hypothetical protein